ncbi:MAG: PAS domain S-box protein [Anaerolineales bacterium]|nr:PAS domain S-box protein [Anaerolineales bacterium]
MTEHEKSIQELLEEIAQQRKRISALEQERDQLRRTQRMWHTLMTKTADLVYFKDSDHHFTQVSQAYADIFEMKRKELLGKTARDLWGAEGEEILLDEKRLLAGEEILHKERKVTGPDGCSRWYLVSKIPIYQDGEVVGFFGVDKDITARKRVEEELKKSEEEKKTILDSLVEHVVHEDTDMKVVWANRAACESAGLPREELIGRYCYQVWPELSEPCPDCPVVEAMKTREPQEIEKNTPNGNAWYIRGYPVKDQNGEIVGGIEVTLDITERQQAIQQNKRRRRYLESLLNAAPDALVTTNENHKIAEWNPGAEQLFGYTKEEAIGKRIDELITRPDVEKEAEEITKKIRAGQYLPPTEVIRYRKDGTPVRVILAGSPIVIDDQMVGAVAVYTDITERVQMEQELRTMALRDDLTELYNRRGFTLLAEQHMKIANREDRRMILLYIDIDELKLINDTYGHPSGDQALKDVAKILQDAFRESDVVARIGGDEFVVLALESNITHPQNLASRLQDTLETHNTNQQRVYDLSLSAGWSCYDPDSPSSLKELMHRADQAMYEEKRDWDPLKDETGSA